MRLFCLLLLMPSLAFANPNADKDYLGVYAGYFDITQGDDSAAQFGLEYRFAEAFYGIRPALGANVTTDGAVYGYGGVFYDFYISDRWIITPGFSAGAFSHGNGKDLGHGIQFRSGIELGYEYDSGRRMSVQFNHISNASLGDRNPGAETLLLQYHIPMGQ